MVNTWTTSATASTYMLCFLGYLQDDHCYVVVTDQKKWEDAKDACVAMGKNLWKIDDAEEDAWMFEQISQHEGKYEHTQLYRISCCYKCCFL